MTKPFGVDELLARMTALLRRSRAAPEPPTASTPLTFGKVTIDLDARLVTKDGEPIHLTPTEFALLRELALSPGKLLSHATLLRRVWGPGYETETEYTRVYVRRLRAKLEDPEGPAAHRHRTTGRLPHDASRRLSGGVMEQQRRTTARAACRCHGRRLRNLSSWSMTARRCL